MASSGLMTISFYYDYPSVVKLGTCLRRGKPFPTSVQHGTTEGPLSPL